MDRQLGSSTSRTGCRGAIGDDGSILRPYRPTPRHGATLIGRAVSRSRAVRRCPWIMSRIGTAGQAAARTLEATEEPTMTDTVPHTMVNAVTGHHRQQWGAFAGDDNCRRPRLLWRQHSRPTQAILKLFALVPSFRPDSRREGFDQRNVHI